MSIPLPTAAAVFTLAFEWGNLIPLLLVALAVIYQIVRGLSEATRGGSDAEASGESSASGEERLRELAERRRRQLRELAEQRRQSGGGGGAPGRAGGQGTARQSTPTAAEDRARSAPPAAEGAAQRRGEGPVPPPPPAGSSSGEARAQRESTARGQPAGPARSERAARARQAAPRNAAGTERERQRRLREAAAGARQSRASRQSTRSGAGGAGGASMPRVRKPAPLVSSRKEITTGEIGSGPATEDPGRKRVGHAAWVRQLVGASPHELQRAIVLKEVFDVPVGLRNQQWTSPPSGD